MSSQLEELVDELSTSSQEDARELDKLPEEVLLHIFKQLPHADKLNCTLVSLKWNRLISTSKKFLESTRFSLKIQLFVENPSMPLDFSISRNYQNFYINLYNMFSITEHDQQLTNIFTDLISIAGHIKQLVFFLVPPQFGFKVFRLLTKCENLQKLTLNEIGNMNFTGDDSQHPELKSIKLSKLRSLGVMSNKHSNWMLKYIDCKELEKLTVNYLLDQDAADFINNLTRLDELQFVALQIAQNIKILPKFKWSTLIFASLSQLPQVSSNQFENLMNRLIVAAKDVAIVKLISFGTNPEGLTQMLTSLERIAGIEKLNFAVGVDGIDQEFINRFKVAFTSAAVPMRNYRVFMMNGSGKSCQIDQRAELAVGCLDWFFALLPNLNHLSISSNFISALDPSTVADLFANIGSLGISGEINDVKLVKLQSLYFPKICVLGFEFDGHHDRLKKFVEMNPSLKEICFANGKAVKMFIITKEKQLVHAGDHVV